MVRWKVLFKILGKSSLTHLWMLVTPMASDLWTVIGWQVLFTFCSALLESVSVFYCNPYLWQDFIINEYYVPLTKSFFPHCPELFCNVIVTIQFCGNHFSFPKHSVLRQLVSPRWSHSKGLFIMFFFNQEICSSFYISTPVAPPSSSRGPKLLPFPFPLHSSEG